MDRGTLTLTLTWELVVGSNFAEEPQATTGFRKFFGQGFWKFGPSKRRSSFTPLQGELGSQHLKGVGHDGGAGVGRRRWGSDSRQVRRQPTATGATSGLMYTAGAAVGRGAPAAAAMPNVRVLLVVKRNHFSKGAHMTRRLSADTAVASHSQSSRGVQ